MLVSGDAMAADNNNNFTARGLASHIKRTAKRKHFTLNVLYMAALALSNFKGAIRGARIDQNNFVYKAVGFLIDKALQQFLEVN